MIYFNDPTDDYPEFECPECGKPVFNIGECSTDCFNSSQL